MLKLERYLNSVESGLHPALYWLERETHLRTNHARMLCGPQVGRYLTTFCELFSPKNVLEIGTFTGYSAISIALGLSKEGHLDAIEINDELEDLILEGFKRAGVLDRITLIFGDAKEIIPTLGKQYDIIYIDANKREYPLYYQISMEILKPGGYIIADNVLWDGKVYMDPLPSDKQTTSIVEFNRMVKEDPRAENYILPLRDGLNIIKKLF
ncbi:MAG: O-methyltransferase [Bacteroidales bacterium]|jgi:predicted O-methyltransferase YrrM|nr:O-methyltransferase [Bacteroidales bacterium]MDD3272739.1 O-methyltransferase [Bacteroidales bacterium]MDD4058132.1 O-methyltransferase [Bacteroidales bacterium]